MTERAAQGKRVRGKGGRAASVGMTGFCFVGCIVAKTQWLKRKSAPLKGKGYGSQERRDGVMECLAPLRGPGCRGCGKPHP
jgi:hypothetical protein